MNQPQVQRITADKLKLLRELPQNERVAATRKHFGYFLAHYMGHYIQYEFADYHYDMMQDVHDLIDGNIRELAWFEYRESAKTSFAKGLLLFIICYDLDPYINADSLDKTNAERILYDVVWELQTNDRIIKDFGELYNTKRSPDEVTQKRVSDFVTNPKKNPDGSIISPGARVEAHSTQEQVRGRIHGAMRPGFVLLDDFETKKSVKSEAATTAVRDHIQEFKGGLDTTRRRVLYLGNVISEYANVQMLIDKAKSDHSLRVRIVPIHDGTTPYWPQKYVMTDKELETNPGKVSIESLKRSMWTPDEGDSDFMAEMLCQPVDETKSIFKREYFQKITWDEIRKKATLCYVTIDTPSIKENSNPNAADYIGFCINWVDHENKWHLKAWREKLGPTDLLDRMFKTYEWLVNIGTKPVRFAWEDTAYTRGLEVALRMEQRRRNIFLPMWWLKPGGRNKEDRIKTALLYRYESRSIYHLENECGALENELLRFPTSANDDCSDATAYQSDIAKPFGEQEKEDKGYQSTPNDPYQRTKRSVYEENMDQDDNSASPFADIGM